MIPIYYHQINWSSRELINKYCINNIINNANCELLSVLTNTKFENYDAEYVFLKKNNDLDKNLNEYKELENEQINKNNIYNGSEKIFFSR